MNKALSQKLENLKRQIVRFPSALLAFSGGTDSTLLAFVSKEILDENLHLVTATSPIYPQSELDDVRRISAFLDLEPDFIEPDVFSITEFVSNSPDRCYHCKKKLFTSIIELAEKRNISAIFDGSNKSDENDFRPGRKALVELGIISPLTLAEMTKTDIYALSNHFNLPTASKPSMACLASRFPYGEMITEQKLARVEKAEKTLHDQGYHQLRVRSHGDLARVELSPEEIQRGFSERDKLVDILKQSGFNWCCIDLQGYRTGAMNEMIKQPERISNNEVKEIGKNQ